MSIPHSVDWDISGVKRAEKETLPRMSPPTVLKISQRYWLTPVQLELVRLLCTGLSLKEMAPMMKITLGTLKVYMVQARRRSGCKTTAQLTAEYVRRVECPAQSVNLTIKS